MCSEPQMLLNKLYCLIANYNFIFKVPDCISILVTHQIPTKLVLWEHPVDHKTLQLWNEAYHQRTKTLGQTDIPKLNWSDFLNFFCRVSLDCFGWVGGCVGDSLENFSPDFLSYDFTDILFCRQILFLIFYVMPRDFPKCGEENAESGYQYNC